MSPTGAVNGQSRIDDPDGSDRSYVTVQSVSGVAPLPSPVAVVNETEVKVIFAFLGLTMYSVPATSAASGPPPAGLKAGAGTTVPGVPPTMKCIEPATFAFGSEQAEARHAGSASVAIIRRLFMGFRGGELA